MLMERTSEFALRPLDPHAEPIGGLTTDELGSQIVGLSGRLAAATCRWLLLVAEFDGRAGYSRFGLANTARWLSHYCGTAHRTAVEHVRVARALAAYPVLATRMSAGRLSYSQVRVISRAASDDEPRLVAELVEMAEHCSAHQLDTMARGLRTVQRNDDPRAPEEYVRHSWSGAGQWRCHARLDPERGAVVNAALEKLSRAEGIERVDALVRLAEIGLAVLEDAGRMPPELRGDERAAILVHLDVRQTVPTSRSGAALDDTSRSAADRNASDQTAADGSAADGSAADRSAADRSAADRPMSPATPASVASAAATSPTTGGFRARLDDGPGLPREVVERLLCAGRIRTVVHDEQGNIRDLGRSHRLVPPRLFRALLLRDRGCRFPGCSSRSALQAHHVRHWLFGGRTAPDNLVLLCERHHHAHHDGEFRILPAGIADRFRFLRADGRELPQHVDVAALIPTAAPIEHEYEHVPRDAATTRWTGERMDRAWAISVLARRRATASADRDSEAAAVRPAAAQPRAAGRSGAAA